MNIKSNVSRPKYDRIIESNEINGIESNEGMTEIIELNKKKIVSNQRKFNKIIGFNEILSLSNIATYVHLPASKIQNQWAATTPFQISQQMITYQSSDFVHILWLSYVEVI